MSKKLQQFFIYKISSDRLRESRYKINIDISQARLNQEIVSISDSQMVRTIHRLTKHQYSQFELDGLLTEKKKLSKRKNSKRNRELISDLNHQIDNYLFIPEIISIHFSDKRHSKKILNLKNIEINNKKYVPFMASSGMIRRNMMLFILESIYDDILKIFENGRDIEKEIVPAKFGTYFSLYSSSSIAVTFPRIAIIPDKIIQTTRLVDYSETPKKELNSFIKTNERFLELNAFDGQGLVSPKMAFIWSKDLELDYVPSCFIVRGSYLKGLCVTFDFHKLAEENGITTLLDIYGNTINLKDIDVIISESQFKLWNSYFSTNDYIQKCNNNGLGWGITRVSPQKEKDSGFSSYQFIQSLSLEQDKIFDLCKPTEDWLSMVSGMDINSVLLYLLGEIEYSNGWFDRLEPNIQALLLENELIGDSYFIKYFEKTLTKKKKDACMGRLIFPSNYQFMISDPYAQTTHALGIEFKSLLQEGNCYSNYWNKKDSDKIGIVRSPIVHYGEVNVLKLSKEDEYKKWYEYIHSGIIFPAYGVSLDMAILGGADVDGDICFSTNYLPFIEGRIESLPIFYETLTAEKYKINNIRDVLIYQSHGFGTKVGFLTNIGSTIASMLNNFSKDSDEYKQLQDRYKYIRVGQGLEIDKQKGLIIPDFPKWWTKRKKITEDMNIQDKEFHTINNKIVIDKRPYFFKFLYEHMGKKWRDEKQGYNNISMTIYNQSFEKILENPIIPEQIELANEYKRTSEFIDNDSFMNRVSHHMEKVLSNIKRSIKKLEVFKYEKLLSENYKKPTKIDIEKMRLLFKEYKSLKRAFREGNHVQYFEKDYTNLNQIKKHINSKAYDAVSSNGTDLANLAVYCCYNIFGKNSKNFLWDCFGKEVVENVLYNTKKKFVRIPIKKENGNIDYLFSKYSMYLVNINE